MVGAAFEQDEESAALGDSAIHLPIANALLGKVFRWVFLDAAAIRVNLPAAGDAPGARLSGAVAQAVLGEHNHAVFEMAVGSALRGMERPAFASKCVQAGGDGEALREEANKTLGETVGHHGKMSLGLLGAALG